MPQFFDILSPQDLFEVLKKRYSQYRKDSQKSSEDLFLVLMFLNHLREWIAPEGSAQNTPDRLFAQKIYDDPNFRIVRELCNGAKHAKRISRGTSTEYANDMFLASDIFAVRDFFKGIPTAHSVDGVPIETIIDAVVAMYQKWFDDNP